MHLQNPDELSQQAPRSPSIVATDVALQTEAVPDAPVPLKHWQPSPTSSQCRPAEVEPAAPEGSIVGGPLELHPGAPATSKTASANVRGE